ncbi:helix-turn-helix transcriptional regulator [Brevundimonas mediterranea]|uniref:helix-turn-helix transcriptional regulator n=1 Tax=Brevundimonas mediterranea TaxID=74329 RepID=UPI001606EC71|nr:AlpA family phage regulatory protein [Brevundimonas mediterranea]
MAQAASPPLKRTIKKPELRQMVPLADSTIWEMEQKGQFPRRFLLTPRCVVWDLAEIEAWLKLRRDRPIPRAAGPDVRLRRSRPVRREDRSGGATASTP